MQLLNEQEMNLEVLYFRGFEPSLKSVKRFWISVDYISTVVDILKFSTISKKVFDHQR